MPLASIKNSIVLVRVDYNISDLKNTQRIVNTIPTIKEVLEPSNKVVIVSHIGRPSGEYKKNLSTKKLVEIIGEEFEKVGVEEEVVHLNQFESFEQAKWKIENSDRRIFLLENARFHPEEKSKDIKKRKILAAQYATLADFFVDEAFAVSHRREATNYDIKEFLPTLLGFSHRREMETLKFLREDPEHPYVFIMGGAKLETKLNLVKKVLLVADKVCLAGLLAFTFVEAGKQLGIEKYKNLELYDSYIEKEFVEDAKELMQKYSEKIVLPVDFVFDEEEKLGKYGADIGEETLKLYKNYVKDAKTIFWNGPLGRYEKEPFNQKTLELAKYIAGLEDCYSVLGGGDIVNSIPDDIASKFSFVSMGGGASLALLGR